MGGGASSMQHRLHKLSADSVQQLVEGIGPSFVEIAKQLRENGLDGEYLESASDEDLVEIFDDLKVPKIKQKLLRRKLAKLKDTDPAPDYGGDVDGWTNTEYTFGNEHWTSDDGETYSLCPMEPGETLLEAARREKKYTVVNWLQSITTYGARYCEKCGHEYCRTTYSWEDLNMDHGLAGDDITYHHCNRSGSTWPPGEGPETKPKDSEESDSNFSSDSYHYEMGCCKCRGFWGKSAKDLVSDSWGCITRPGPNGTRVKENAR